MKKNRLTQLMLLISFTLLLSTNTYAAGSDDLVITVNTNNTTAGSTPNNEFQIPINNDGGGVTFHYNVDCDNNGINEVDDFSGAYTCVYGSPGTYTIRIEDKIGDGSGFLGLAFDNGGDKNKLLTIEQWGTFQWKFLSGAFWGCANLVFNATDTPDFSGTGDLSNMFRFASNANPDTTNWDVSNVTSMSAMFRSASAATPNTSNWDTSQVQTMSNMFRNAFVANPNVTGWDVTNVSNMDLMFINVTLPTTDYDKLLITFNGQNVQSGISFHGGNSKYCATGAHNQLELTHGWNTIVDGGNEITSNCPNPANDFVMTIKTDNLSTGSTGTTSMKIPTIGAGYNYSVDWDGDGNFEQAGITGDVTHDYGAAGTYSVRIRGDFPRIYFNYTGDRLKIIDITQWGDNPWTSMENAFAGASNLMVTANFAPNLSNLTSLEGMFVEAVLANPNTNFWDVSNVTNMARMFEEAISANPNVQNWDISNVTDMDGMFSAVTLPSADYDDMLIHFASQSTHALIFDGGDSQFCSRAAQVARDHLDNTWDMNDGGLDASCGALADDFVIKIDTTLTGTGGTSNTEFEISTIAGHYNVDCNNDYINEITGHTGNYICDFSALGGAGIHTIRIMDNTGNNNTGFRNLHFTFDSYKYIDIVQWGKAPWTDMSGAFQGASNLVITATDTPNFSSVTTMASMFANASLVNPNTTNWDTSSVENMAIMFRGASAANPDTNNWDTSQVTDMRNMFKLATSATLTSNGLDTQNVIFMQEMFSGASIANPDTSNWDVGNVQHMGAMFQYAFLANPDVSNWNISNITIMGFMFNGVTLPTADYDNLLINFNSQILNSGVNFSGGNSKYCAVVAHDGLENTHSWNITDGGLDPMCDNDIIFKNSFEIPVTKFNAVEKQFVFDFSLLDNIKLDTYPELIAIGLDNEQEKVIKIHIRKLAAQLQIRMSHFYQDEFDGEQWVGEQWQNIDNNKLTTISW